ncbi:MAG: thioredoxin domain-containing protein [Methylovirgula sp.]
MSNELAKAASPYLLQHKDNPVYWRLWSPAALAEAEAANKPILLSVGYAACHWCHVMAHESFEDPATAAVMNELFVNIKVDREERPDIDHIYMQALHAFGEHGGWPMTLFLTPRGEPFWGGTYFPKEARYGRPAFVTVLRSVAKAFHDEQGKLTSNAEAVRESLGRVQHAAAGTAPLSLALADALAPKLADYIDPIDGGLRGAPKFPKPAISEFLWRAGRRLGNKNYRDLVRLTLTKMSEGGIYDHLGGGYARYSTDDRWLVPHFEKMLYDNAQILELLALAWQAFGDDLFRQRAYETVGWLAREMTNDGGGFCASLDADSEGEEGKFYVWTWPELIEVLGAEDAAFFGKFYNASRIGNWAEEKHGKSVTILNRLELKAPPIAEEEARLAALRQKLFAVRERRVHPGLDDKIMADWNGLMIAALFHAATTFGEPRWIALAARAYHYVVDHLQFADADGARRLAHSTRADVVVKPGLALDHAAMARAALALHEARNMTGAEVTSYDYLADAIAFTEAIARHHIDAETGLIAMAADDARDIVIRLTPTADDAIPNAHSVTLYVLARLAAATGDDKWRTRADALFTAVTPAVTAQPIGHAGILNALDLYLRGREIVVAGPERQALYEAALAAPFDTRMVLDLEPGAALPPSHPAQAQIAAAGTAAAFVCSGGVCSLPVHDIGGLNALLAR